MTLSEAQEAIGLTVRPTWASKDAHWILDRLIDDAHAVLRGGMVVPLARLELTRNGRYELECRRERARREEEQREKASSLKQRIADLQAAAEQQAEIVAGAARTNQELVDTLLRAGVAEAKADLMKNERDAARAEVEHWKRARQTAMEDAENFRAEVERMKAELAAAKCAAVSDRFGSVCTLPLGHDGFHAEGGHVWDGTATRSVGEGKSPAVGAGDAGSSPAGPTDTKQPAVSERKPSPSFEEWHTALFSSPICVHLRWERHHKFWRQFYLLTSLPEIFIGRTCREVWDSLHGNRERIAKLERALADVACCLGYDVEDGQDPEAVAVALKARIAGDEEAAARNSLRIAKLEAGILAVAALINESRGVVGLHLNGDEARWDELRTCGRYEDWLSAFDDALELASGRVK